MGAGEGNLISMHSNDFAKKRLELTVSLFYKMLENIAKHEKGKCPAVGSDKIERQSKVLNIEIFHVSLFRLLC